jgi:hypothetical protein
LAAYLAGGSGAAPRMTQGLSIAGLLEILPVGLNIPPLASQSARKRSSSAALVDGRLSPTHAARRTAGKRAEMKIARMTLVPTRLLRLYEENARTANQGPDSKTAAPV